MGGAKRRLAAARPAASTSRPGGRRGGVGEEDDAAPRCLSRPRLERLRAAAAVQPSTLDHLDHLSWKKGSSAHPGTRLASCCSLTTAEASVASVVLLAGLKPTPSPALDSCLETK